MCKGILLRNSIEKPKRNILVVGIGNTLLRDDGVGVHVVEALRRHNLPLGVEVIDAGTGVLNLLHELAEQRKVIVVDAARGGSSPGSVYRFTPADVEIDCSTPASAHHIGLRETLVIAAHLGRSPGEVVIFGVEPKLVDWGMELSPEVAEAVPAVARMVLEEVGKASSFPRRRECTRTLLRPGLMDSRLRGNDGGGRENGIGESPQAFASATTDATTYDTTTRAHVMVRGIVQGVGFRPFVHRIANTRGLAGWVLNSTDGVEIEVEGTSQNVEGFLHDLSARAPAAASIHRIDVQHLPPAGYSSFTIENSHQALSGFPLVSPDIATCPDCLAELFEVTDRRHRFPFINCTSCGPRFTIVEGIPYDRTRTTMKAFTMCPTCQKEYDDPNNRRFHAQPNACHECGPSMWLSAASSDALSEADPIIEARRLLKAGKIVAVKGLGGFHLVCDAANAAAVRELRQRKRRVEKPFALMAGDLEAARRLCYVSDAEAQLLASTRRPIVLLEKRKAAPVAPEVAPGNKRLGVFLPYTPIHHLLLETTPDIRFDALVMTSGNLSEEPIAKDNDEAISRLAQLADCFVLHDRHIDARCDDSVTQVFEGKESLIRRARGYAPLPIRLDFPLERVLACGAQLKNTFCITNGGYAFLSQHLGDLDNQETLDFFAQAIEHFVRVFNLNPRIIAHDLHPDYLSTRFALSRVAAGPGPAGSMFEEPDKDVARGLVPRWGTGGGQAPALHSAHVDLTVVGVQHHHAHIASCMAENGLRGKVIGVAFDGTGYGTDGTLWGGEFLIADYSGFERASHLKSVLMPGGEMAIRKPYRMALSYLVAAYGDRLPEIGLTGNVDPDELDIVRTQLARGVNSPPTSSCGRLFDAVSALAGIRGEITYEGQAAIELEMAAADGVADAYVFGYRGAAPLVIDCAPVIRAVVEDLRSGKPVEVVSARFHNGVAKMIAEVCRRIRQGTGLNRVCLSGGVFQNRLLLRRALEELRQNDFETYIHHLVPCNDGGISLGQAIVASERARELKE